MEGKNHLIKLGTVILDRRRKKISQNPNKIVKQILKSMNQLIWKYQWKKMKKKINKDF